jgi:hypothetical protein
MRKHPPYWIAVGEKKGRLINDDECYATLEAAKTAASEHPFFEIYDDRGNLIVKKPT